MKYGKIVCGALNVPQNYPCSIELDGQTINNPTEEQLVAAGYLPIEEVEPEEREGKIAIASYKVNKAKTKIVQSWSYVDAPEPQPEDIAPTPAEEPAEESAED